MEYSKIIIYTLMFGPFAFGILHAIFAEDTSTERDAWKVGERK